ncbi:hypothetical protein [Allorhizocola rhizosphaerae]|uniref:hypothetical protein n=1 Tax=Allorhizocola rhizosphaerae TaxID=1872709 RepID=UPI000E3C00C2|nr:hypothetical protein [Allorhizocola rhizosphaerae]
MRLVVGPLPASVYWRRRALVLGGVALVVAMIVYSCATTDKTAATPGPASSPTPAPDTTPSPSPSAGVVAPAVVTSSSPTQPPPAVDASTCTDAELSVTAVPAKTTAPSGAELHIKLLIKNTSQRSCTRDIGPDQQELYIVDGANRVWSSDHCDGPTGSELRTFPAGHERSYEVVWNGKSSSSCAARRAPDGPTPTPGEYQLLGRVGTDLSQPVTLKLT